jgi:hypothetical protein
MNVLDMLAAQRSADYTQGCNPKTAELIPMKFDIGVTAVGTFCFECNRSD